MLWETLKKYNTVWLDEQEMQLNRFVFWRDTPEEKIRDYAITMVNILDRPDGYIAHLAM